MIAAVDLTRLLKQVSAMWLRGPWHYAYDYSGPNQCLAVVCTIDYLLALCRQHPLKAVRLDPKVSHR